MIAGGSTRIWTHIFSIDLNTLLSGDLVTLLPTKTLASNLETSSIVPGHLYLIDTDPIH